MPPSAANRHRVSELRQRVLRMQGAAVTRTLDSLPGLAGVLQLKTGGAYAVDSLSLAMALMAGPSNAGEWSAVVGMPDFGLAAASAYGLDLDRTVIVPRPGEHWLSVTAGLLEAATVVAIRPPARVTENQAERLRSRLRQKDASLICLGEWPRADATVRVVRSTWMGLGRGHGHLTARLVDVEVQQSGPVRQASLWLPALDQSVASADEHVMPISAAKAG